MSLLLAVSAVTRTKNPELALRVVPWESVALASRADQIFFANPKNPSPIVRDMALAALQHQPVNAKALRLLGYFADTKADKANAEQFTRLAAKMSRREVGAQMWLIEAAAREGNDMQALRHFDIALRTKPEVQLILFPRLVAAIDSAEIRAQMRPYMKSRDGWADDFLMFATTHSKNPSSIVDLIIAADGMRGMENSETHKLALLNRLVGDRLFDEARRLYLQMSEASPDRLANADLKLSKLDGRFGPISWQVFDEVDAGGTLVNDTSENKITMSVFANNATTRTVARKLLYLRPGDYSFGSNISFSSLEKGGFLRWQLRCPKDLASKAVWSLDTFDEVVRSNMTIPADCTVQFLELIASGGDGSSGLEATIESVSLLKTKGSLSAEIQ